MNKGGVVTDEEMEVKQAGPGQAVNPVILLRSPAQGCPHSKISSRDVYRKLLAQTTHSSSEFRAGCWKPSLGEFSGSLLLWSPVS